MRTTACLLTWSLLAFGCAGATEEPETPAATPAYDSESFAVVDETAFRELIPADARVTQLTTGHEFVEGPVWIDEDGGYLVFSDIPANELKRWDPTNGAQTFRAPSNSANGNTLDLEGRLVTAQHDGRVTRTEADLTVVTIAERYEGGRLNSPNDVVVKSDGTIWFTDPSYGLGERAQETPGNYVYRLDPASQAVTAVVTDMEMPNGLCFSPDENILYVADAGSPGHIRAFTLEADGTTSGGAALATIDQGFPDGIRCDELGNVWSSSGDGAQIFSPDGALIGRILLPEGAANLAFGGPDGTTVYFTARTSVYSIPSLVHDGALR
jgi:gluconolactonase